MTRMERYAALIVYVLFGLGLAIVATAVIGEAFG